MNNKIEGLSQLNSELFDDKATATTAKVAEAPAKVAEAPKKADASKEPEAKQSKLEADKKDEGVVKPAVIDPEKESSYMRMLHPGKDDQVNAVKNLNDSIMDKKKPDFKQMTTDEIEE